MKNSIKFTVFCCLLVSVLLLTGCSLQKKLTGTKWETGESYEKDGFSYSTTMQFEFKGRDVLASTIILENNNPAALDQNICNYEEGTWSIADGILTMNLSLTTLKFNVSLKDNTLTLASTENSEALVLKKCKK